MIFNLSRRRTLFTRAKQGQSLVEFALVLPILLLILLGVVDLGRVYYAYVTLTNASREGARFGATYGWTTPTTTQSAIRNRTKNESANVLKLADSNIIVECSATDTPPFIYTWTNCSSVNPGYAVRVTVNYTFTLYSLSLVGVKDLGLSNNTSMAIITKN
jgi:Flp pilus assembly protein TadG